MGYCAPIIAMYSARSANASRHWIARRAPVIPAPSVAASTRCSQPGPAPDSSMRASMSRNCAVNAPFTPAENSASVVAGSLPCSPSRMSSAT